ncbi:KGK family protein [Richelia sinica FACHB-800]|uniref:KGK family protein n=1 Tax=Richelia sinica FACHB-800 TaxID=1357546 RepID=A0A975T9U4_9NOST|nr:KGK domain-containing protein [Richelia sinica]MBD2665886.1 KGK family protein [Richelia sinica FACHB-800]QXE24011.1 KGK family protein [Richelia sinica FACHB-800]
MNHLFIPLDSDNDVLLIGKDTFIISRLKEILKRQIKDKLNQQIYNAENQSQGIMANTLGIFSVGETYLYTKEFRFETINSCQLLKVGSQGWQKGQLKITICIVFAQEHIEEIQLEFAPDQGEINNHISPPMVNLHPIYSR